MKGPAFMQDFSFSANPGFKNSTTNVQNSIRFLVKHWNACTLNICSGVLVFGISSDDYRLFIDP